MINLLREIAQEYSKLDCVYAVVQAGSRTSQQDDNLSDYDIYIYTDKEISIEFRTKLAQKYSSDFEINNQYFETGDEWNLVQKYGNAVFDFMFRCPNWITESIENVYNRHCASNGYTTCFLHNVKTSKILFDKNNWFLNLQKKISGEYPIELQNNIIKRNLMLLKDKKNASYFAQINLAIQRNDSVSIQHRTTAFLASYFDILFAVNKIYHPGEKRLIKYAKNHCSILPENFEGDITSLLKADGLEKIKILSIVLERLRKILP